MVGPGKPIDTDRFFVICANVLGGCMGSTGPASIDPATGKPYGLDFPVVTIRDMVRAQAMLVEHLGIEQAVLRWSAARWAACRCCNGRRPIPTACFAAVPIASAARHSAQNIAFHEVGRQAIMADPDWRGGEYLSARRQAVEGPGRGAHGRAYHLSVGDGAAAQVRPQPAEPRRRCPSASTPDFQIEILSASPGRRPSSTASTPTPISTSPARWIISTWPPSMAASWRRPSANPARFCIISFTSDWLFPTVENKRDRPCPERGRRRRSASSRSRATRATTPSCSTSRRCSPRCAASCAPPRRRHRVSAMNAP